MLFTSSISGHNVMADWCILLQSHEDFQINGKYQNVIYKVTLTQTRGSDFGFRRVLFGFSSVTQQFQQILRHFVVWSYLMHSTLNYPIQSDSSLASLSLFLIQGALSLRMLDFYLRLCLFQFKPASNRLFGVVFCLARNTQLIPL